MSDKKLKMAIQKSGRLSERSAALLKKCDIGFDNGLGKLRSVAENFPLEILFLRDDDIPQYIEDGVADAGIVGMNTVDEAGSKIEVVEKLGFGKCRLAIAIPRAMGFNSLDDLRGKKIATSYPKLLGNYLETKNVDAEIHTISGSVEIAPSIGVADAICDLVSSGSTLFTNGLREVETVMQSEAVLAAREGLDPEKKNLLDKLLFRISSVIAAGRNKYILLNAPNEKLDEVIALLPGMKSPTVMPLSTGGWSSVHSVIGEDEFWEIVEKLKAAGAQGILVTAIDQMIR
jgi:ATP phosphoribosyltransferase